jgi:hypothetical protein
MRGLDTDRPLFIVRERPVLDRRKAAVAVPSRKTGQPESSNEKPVGALCLGAGWLTRLTGLGAGAGVAESTV